MIKTLPIPQAPRRYGRVNWLGLWTLILRETRRFAKVHTQTIAAPVVTTLLFLAVFVLALGGDIAMKGGVSFGEFLAPGQETLLKTRFENFLRDSVIRNMPEPDRPRHTLDIARMSDGAMLAHKTLVLF
jgi:hypothetical protein